MSIINFALQNEIWNGLGHLNQEAAIEEIELFFVILNKAEAKYSVGWVYKKIESNI